MGLLTDLPEPEPDDDYPATLPRSARSLVDMWRGMDDDDRRVLGGWFERGVTTAEIIGRLRDAGFRFSDSGVPAWRAWMEQEKPWET